MQISMQLSYSGGFKEAADTVAELEKAGLDLVWVAEAYGFDAPSLMGYVAAKTTTVQIQGAGTPANCQISYVESAAADTPPTVSFNGTAANCG